MKEQGLPVIYRDLYLHLREGDRNAPLTSFNEWGAELIWRIDCGSFKVDGEEDDADDFLRIKSTEGLLMAAEVVEIIWTSLSPPDYKWELMRKDAR